MLLCPVIQPSALKAALLSLGFVISCVPALALNSELQETADLVVELNGGRLSIEAENIQRQVLLERVSEAGAFRLDIRGEISDDDRLSFSFEQRPVRDAIPWLVGKHAYALIERPDPAKRSPPERLLVIFDQDQTASAPLPPAVSDEPVGPSGPSSDLIEMLESEDPYERLAAVARAKLLQPEDALSVLNAALDPERERKTRSRAIAALLRLTSPEAETILREIALSNDDGALRIQALRALSTRLGAGAVGLLDDILKGETRNRIRLAALASLQRIGSDDALTSIELALSDGDARIRAAAKRALNGEDVIRKRRGRYR